MKIDIRSAVVLIGLSPVIGLVNLEIAGRQEVLATGTVIYLPLDPVAENGPLNSVLAEWRPGVFHHRFTPTIRPEDAADRLPGYSGTVMVMLDERKIVRSVRHDDGVAPGQGEHALHYRGLGEARYLGRQVTWDPARREAPAYAVLHVSAEGSAILSGLADRELRRIDR